MPCFDPQARDEGKDLKKRLNEATRVACELAKLIPNGSEVTFETYKWILAHEESDKKRAKTE